MYKFSHIADDTAFSSFLSGEDATLAFGRQLARALIPGMVVFLEGDLGAGKTTLTRGILRGFHFEGRVKSPTYTLVEPYSLLGLEANSNLYLYHFDLYRFNDPSEWEDAGFRDYFNSESICLIEWADKADGQLPAPDWVIQLQASGEGRQILLCATSELGQTCQNALTSATK